MDATMNHLQLVRHLASRLGVLLRAYGQRMKRAEYQFTEYLKAPSADDRAARWADYKRESHKADRLSLRHHRIARRALGISNG